MAINGSQNGANFDLDGAIRKVPDFPKPGILFYDVTGILSKPEAFSYCIERMLAAYKDTPLDAVAAVEARGFVFAAPFAHARGLPIILVRKKGKLPGDTIERSYSLEYGTATLEAHRADIRPGARVLVVDDLIATGGTVRAAAEIIREAGADPVGVFSVVGLPFLDYRKEIGDMDLVTLISYHGE